MAAQWGTGNFSPAIVSIRDYTPAGTGPGEPTNFQCYGPVLSAGNFAAKTALWQNGTDGLVDTIQVITLGLIMSWEYGNLHVSNVSGGASSVAAQRENKLLVDYKDNTTQKPYRCTLPTIDLTKLTFQFRDIVDIATGTEMIAFVTAFQAFAVAPITGNAVTITGAKYVGRNS